MNSKKWYLHTLAKVFLYSTHIINLLEDTEADYIVINVNKKTSFKLYIKDVKVLTSKSLDIKFKNLIDSCSKNNKMNIIFYINAEKKIGFFHYINGDIKTEIVEINTPKLIDLINNPL